MLFEMAIKFTITSGFAKPLKEQLENVKDKIQDSYEIETIFFTSRRIKLGGRYYKTTMGRRVLYLYIV